MYRPSMWQLMLLTATIVTASPSNRRRSPLAAQNLDPRKTLSAIPVGETITECVEPGMVALTYDDGPGPYTQQLLDILESNKVQATFFINGDNRVGPITNPDNAQLLQAVHSRGHQIGSHSWSHPDLSTLSSAQRWTEMHRLQDALEEILGVVPRYMRPPYFSCNAACLEDMGEWNFHVVNANLDTKDYQGDYGAARATYSTALEADPATSSFIVLVHEIHPLTVDPFTEFMISEAYDKGYRLVTLGECLGDPETNWYRRVAESGGNDTTSHGANDGN